MRVLHSRYFYQILLLVPLAILIHYCKPVVLNKLSSFYYPLTGVEVMDKAEYCCDFLSHELIALRHDLNNVMGKLEEIEDWKENILNDMSVKLDEALDVYNSDQIGVFDYAAAYAGGSILSTPDTIPYQSMTGLSFFRSFDWIIKSQSKLILEANKLPGQCFAFCGNMGRIRVQLGVPIVITHISLEHHRMKGIDQKSAPRKFQILGLDQYFTENYLGNFTYDLNAKMVQTFQVTPREKTFKFVELRILDNHGNNEFTCIYRFRVHSLFV